MPSNLARSARWLQHALLSAGLVALAWVGFTATERVMYRQQVETVLAATPASARDIRLETEAPFQGLIQIPRLGFSEAFAEGDDDTTLRAAIGHLKDTPRPWSNGNAAFAGHRDTHFRALKGIRVGDGISVKTPRGVFQYRVTELFIVQPDDVWVLAPTAGRELTLITCYPFSFIGHAPQRFVVKAEPIEPAPVVVPRRSRASGVSVASDPALSSRPRRG